MEAELEAVMAEQQETEQKLADPATYADHALSGELLNRYNELKDRCDALVEELDGLESRIAAMEQENAQ